MVITPLDSINVVEEYIKSIHLVQKNQSNKTLVINMPIIEYQKNREEFKSDNIR